MPLTTCPDCGKQVSTNAASCINCGAPLQRAGDPKSVVTTQQTSKPFKAVQLVGVLLMLGGVVACSVGESGPSAGMWLIGLFLYIAGRASAWWNHG